MEKLESEVAFDQLNRAVIWKWRGETSLGWGRFTEEKMSKSVIFCFVSNYV